MKTLHLLAALLLSAAAVAATRRKYGFQPPLVAEKAMAEEKIRASWEQQDVVNFFVGRSPLQYAAMLFSFFSVIGFLKVWLSDQPSNEDYHKARSTLIQLIKRYEATSNHLINRLSIVEGKESTEIEYRFLRRQDELLTNISALARLVGSEPHPGLTTCDILGTCATAREKDTAYVEPFKDFIKGWLKVFGQCSPKPLEEPYEICKCTGEIDKMTRMSEIVSHLCKHMQDRPINFVAKETDAFRTTHMRRTEELLGGHSRRRRFWLTLRCGVGFGLTVNNVENNPNSPFPIVLDCCCARMEFFSFWHLRGTLYMIYGIGMLLALLGTGDRTFAMMVGSAVALNLVLLLLFVNSIDDHGRLVSDAKRVTLEKQKAEQDLQRIEATVDLMQEAGNLWKYHTLPRLALYANAMTLMLKEMLHGEDVVRSIADQLQHVEDTFGNPDLWTGPKALPVSFMKAASKQLEGPIQSLEDSLKAAGRHSLKLGLRNSFALVTVVIHACHNLPDMDEGVLDLTDACVVVKVGKETRRTHTIQDNLNPTWTDEKFIMPVSTFDQVVKVEVYDQDEAQDYDDSEEKPKGKPQYEPIGFVEAPLRAKPGEWVWKRERLQSFHHSRKPHQGEVEFRFHFASSMRDLECMRPSGGGHSPGGGRSP